MIDPLGPELSDPHRPSAPAREVGSRHSADEKPVPPNPSTQGKGKETKPASPTATLPASRTALTTRPSSQTAKTGGFGRALGAVRAALPVVQKLLPLLDGNIAFAAANFLAPQGQHVDLVPLESALNKLQTEQRTMRGQI